MEANAVLRIEKIKQSTETAAHNHNLRASNTKKEPNVDCSKSHLNRIILGNRNTVATINEKVEQRTNKKKLRDDANRAIEFVLSASPEHFYDFKKVGMTREEWDDLIPANFKDNIQAYWKRVNEVKSTLKHDETKKWLADAKDWIQKEFGENVINAVVHFDEKTPHIHLLCVPMVKGKLTAKDFFTPDNAKKWQTSYALATGLKRGVASEKKHEALKDAEINKAKQEARKEGLELAKEDLTQWKQEKAKEYKEHYKKRFEKKGYQDGMNQAKEDAKKKFGFVDSFKLAWHNPSKKAQEEAQRAIADAKKKQEQAEEETRKTKNQADNRVTKIADDLRKAKSKIEEINDDLTKSQEREHTLHKQLDYYKKNAPHLPVPK